MLLASIPPIRPGAMAKPLKKAAINPNGFNPAVKLPFNLRDSDFKSAMQDIYDFLHDTNQFLVDKGLPRLDDTVRAANMSGLLSDMLTDSMAKHARNMARNTFHNGHPDLLVGGVYPNNSVQSGTDGVEIKATNKKGGAVDTHGARQAPFQRNTPPDVLAFFIFTAWPARMGPNAAGGTAMGAWGKDMGWVCLSRAFEADPASPALTHLP
jgi:hypothetical protein